LAQTGGRRAGRACPLCPGISDINLFGYCEGVIDLDAEISDGAFDLGMPEQELDSPEIARPSIDQGGLGATERMRAEQPRVETDAADPLRDGAYWRIVMLRSGPRWPVNKNSPGRLPVIFR
jgi:hypothetical protein